MERDNREQLREHFRLSRGTDICKIGQMCDVYMPYSPHMIVPGAGRTYVNVGDDFSDVKELANVALDLYNKKNQKNFNLMRVIKLNVAGCYDYLTFWARDDGSDDYYVFRCSINGVEEWISLYETRCQGENAISIEHVDDFLQKLGEIGKDQPFNTRKKDLEDGSYVASNGGILVSPTMFCMPRRESLSDLKMCDDFMDPCLYEHCGTMTLVYVDSYDWVWKYATLAMDFYNKKEDTNFNLLIVEKLYTISSAYYCMTFWAGKNGSDEIRLFRALVCLEDDDKGNMKLSDSDEDFIPLERSPSITSGESVPDDWKEL